MSDVSVGVDLGGTNIRVAAFSASRGLLAQASALNPRSGGPEAAADCIQQLVQEVVGRSASEHPLRGICIAAPGPLELPAGITHSPPNLPGWDYFNLRAAVEHRLQQEVIVENDANVAALAEFHLGVGRDLGCKDLMMLTLGTGVGQGIVTEGKIQHGANGLAGEAGHCSVWPDGLDCACGNSGCLEMYVSATALRRLAIKAVDDGGSDGLLQLAQLNPHFSAHDLFQLAQAGDASAQAIFNKAGMALGIAIATQINTLNPAAVVIGGGVAAAWDAFQETLFSELERRSYVYRLTAGNGRFASQTRVLPAKLVGQAGVVGAALLPLLEKNIPVNANILDVRA